MSEGVSEVTALAADLQQVLARLFTVMRDAGTPRPVPGRTSPWRSVDPADADRQRARIRMTELAAHERVRTPTTTVAIRRLEKLSLVKRSRDPSDCAGGPGGRSPGGSGPVPPEALDARRHPSVRTAGPPERRLGTGRPGATLKPLQLFFAVDRQRGLAASRLNPASQAPPPPSTTAACCRAVRPLNGS